MRARVCGIAIVVASLLACGAANAMVTEFSAVLSGATEETPTFSNGHGFADIFYDDVTHLLEVKVTFSGLEGETIASHIHAGTSAPFSGTAVVASTTPTFPGFPLGVTDGSYDHTLDLSLASSFNAAFVNNSGGTIAASEAALIFAMRNNEAYLNIHTTMFNNGEIEGFLQVVPTVPESSSAALFVFGSVIFAAFKACRRE